MIDYDTFCRIHHLHQRDGLNVSQIAHALGLDARTVSHWLTQSHFRARRSMPEGTLPPVMNARQHDSPGGCQRIATTILHGRITP